MLETFIPYTATLKSSAAHASTVTGSAIDFPADLHSAQFILDVTAATGTSPTLDLSIQVTPDDGTTWYTAFRFIQATGAVIQRLAACFFSGSGNTATTVTNAGGGNVCTIATTGGALSTGVPISKKIRLLGTIGGTNPSITYAVHVIGKRAQSLGTSY